MTLMPKVGEQKWLADPRCGARSFVIDRIEVVVTDVNGIRIPADMLCETQREAEELCKEFQTGR